MIEKIYFDKETYIWKTNLKLNNYKNEILKEAYHIIDLQKNSVKHDGYAYKQVWKGNLDFDGVINVENKLDLIYQMGIDYCKKIYTQEVNTKFNKVNTDSWVNIVRSKNPVQIQFKHDEIKGVDKFHTHTEINKQMKSFVPNYTYVYYIQMPDIMEGEDGVLYFKSKNGNEYYIKPEEDELIIMEADMAHAPNNAPKSSIDRIVLAGNVGFEYIKKEKSLL